MAKFEPSLRVFRHASDDAAHDCGRACAQSIISSLTQGVQHGKEPNAAERAQPVPVTQGELHADEDKPLDQAGKWFTHPKELKNLLNKHLVTVGRAHWEIAHEVEKEDLLVHVGASLQQGFPAVLNIRESDHWVLVQSVDETNGIVSFVRLLDPLETGNSPSASDHTYVDGCALNGELLWETFDLTTASLGELELKVGNKEPNDFEGQCVAIVFGTVGPDLQAKRRLRRRQRLQWRRPGGATPSERIFEELKRISEAYDVPEVAALLRERREPTIRFVHDIDAKERGYTMSGVFSNELGYGLIGIYDFNDQAFRHARLTSDRMLVAGLAGDPAEPLWWTRRPLETLFSPYFPFRRVSGGLKPIYRRLADDHELVGEPPPPAAPRA